MQKPRSNESVPLAIVDENLRQHDVELVLVETAIHHARSTHDRPHVHRKIERDQRLGDKHVFTGVPKFDSLLARGSGSAHTINAM